MSAGAIVVTGASTGIGRATVLRLARAGHRVFAGVRKEADAESIRAERIPTLQPVFLDVADAATIEAASKQVGAAVGDEGLAGLVNNAGITMGGPVEIVPLDDLRRVLEVNTVGPIAVTQAFMPLIRKATGRLVFTTSIGGRVSGPVIGPYTASKFALEALCDALRVELRPWKIHVAVIEPGAIRTEIFDKSRSLKEELMEAFGEEEKARYGAMAESVMDRFDDLEKNALEPDAVAKVIEHALTSGSPRTRYLVGTDARIQAALGWLLPDAPFDAIRARLFGIPSEPPR